MFSNASFLFKLALNLYKTLFHQITKETPKTRNRRLALTTDNNSASADINMQVEKDQSDYDFYIMSRIVGKHPEAQKFSLELKCAAVYLNLLKCKNPKTYFTFVFLSSDVFY